MSQKFKFRTRFNKSISYVDHCFDKRAIFMLKVNIIKLELKLLQLNKFRFVCILLHIISVCVNKYRKIDSYKRFDLQNLHQ